MGPSGPVSILWNLKTYGVYQGAQWLGRALSYRAWLKFMPDGRREGAFDKINGVDTDGYISRQDLGLPSDSIHYAPIKPRQFFSLLSKLKIARRDFTFIDIGCGKGRPILLAHSMGFRKLLGVELSAALTEIARNNTKSIGAQITQGDAAEFEFPAEPSVVFLFNPFWSPTIDKFAENLSHSLSESPRDLYVVYVNPFSELAFDRQPTLVPMLGVRNYYRIYRSRLGQMFTPLSKEVKYGEQIERAARWNYH